METRIVLLAVIAAVALLCLCSCEPGAARGSRKSDLVKPQTPPQAKLPAPGSEKGGLASLYAGDQDIELDPRVLFVEDFETGTIKEIGERWGQVSRPENMLLDGSESHANSPGARSLKIAKNGHFYTHTKPVDTFYTRFYVKFHPKHGYNHHFVGIVADRAPTPWPKGGAGLKPAGDMKFNTAIEPTGRWGKYPPPGVWNFYTYWHKMATKWGTTFNGKQEKIEPGRWYCVEVMVKANTPGQADGEQAFWIDGEQYGHFKEIEWRTTDRLKLNSFWLSYYNTDQPARHNKDPNPESRVMEVWFDDIVVATEYVGPVTGKPKTKSGKKAARPSKSALLTAGLCIAEPGKVIYACDFEKGPDKFKGGEVVDEGGGKALAIPPKGGSLWHAFSTPVKDSTTIRFRLKNMSEANKALVMIWSKKIKDNCRYDVWLPKKGEWKTVEMRAFEPHVGWERNGPNLDGDVCDNFMIMFEGKEGEKLLIDDFRVHE